ncbi:MAG TPA: sigma-70 family RNA polymerase sigma factor [Acidobacteriota bacterium]|nr:sigma-70 family RNA polymerase sigma factor [Acidobacteriota bacterium]
MTTTTSQAKPKNAKHAPQLQEARLLKEVLAGRHEAYGPIFDRYRDQALGLALTYTRNREDARDVVQEAFIKAFQNLEHFDRGRRFGPWLLSIVRNLSIDLLRRRKFDGPELVQETLSDGSSLREGERRLIRREIEEVMSRLKAPHRRIILLRELQGFSYAEIAQQLGIPIGTVMSRLHQARRCFKRETARRSARRHGAAGRSFASAA